MYLPIKTWPSTRRNWDSCTPDQQSALTDELAAQIAAADAVVVGGGAGLSAAAGFAYEGPRFEKHFADFRRAYGIRDMYSGGFYPYKTLEEYWAWWSRAIWVNRYDVEAGKPYRDLLSLVAPKEYFVLTTNVDHQFQLAGFAKERLFYTQGDYGLWQCSAPCHAETYDNREAVEAMVAAQQGCRIPRELVPLCPVCGEPMTMNLRCDETFVEDAGWHGAAARYREFLEAHQGQRVLFLELGVGQNTPGIIKYPFWQQVAKNPQARYCSLNDGQAQAPAQIAKRSLCIDGDMAPVLAQAAAKAQ